MSCHFSDGDISIVPSKRKLPDHWEVTFWRNGKTVKITMQIPMSGIFEDPNSTDVLNEPACTKLAKKIANILRKELIKASPLKKPKR